MSSSIPDKIRNLLKKTYAPFFGSFGKITSIQEGLIPLIMSGKNAFGVSPAASGKTEAALAPFAELMLQSKSPALGILYIAPTRALINDIALRIRAPLLTLSLDIAVRTGDRPELNTRQPEHLLLTTPESFDSLLCRYPKIWNQTRFVIIDEIHLLDNTARGDQLRVLIRRLELLKAAHSLQYCALSATVSDPEGMAQRYFSDFTVISASQERTITDHLVSDIKAVVGFLREERRHKAMIFCNSRKETEELARELKKLWPADRILVHHGSLSKKEREGVEHTFRSWQWGLCVCTMTMELGIDIGNIEAVVLYGPPPTTSAFLQRIGRGGRRSHQMVVVGCYRNDPVERFQLITMGGLAQAGIVEKKEYIPNLSVCVQQIFSLLYGHPQGLTDDLLWEIISLLTEYNIFKEIISHLEQTGFVERASQRWRATGKLMDLGARGFIHSNIAQTKEYRVISAATGKEIGGLYIEATVGGQFILAGRTWKILQIKSRAKVLVVAAEQSDQGEAKFAKRCSNGAFARYLPKTF
ncbi:MAG: DEAD/DEAH box helicase [Pseudomonadota bacterium]